MSDNTRLKESLSALMDDSADELELHRTLRSVSDDPELRESWHRYQLARSAMHGELPSVAIDLSTTISQAIEQESRHGQGMQRLLKPLSRLAIAASVTVVAVLGVQQYQQADPDAGLPLVATHADALPAPLQMPNGFAPPPIVTAAVSSDGGVVARQPQRTLVLFGQPKMDPVLRQQVQDYFDELMKRHTEQAALGANQGMLPFARLPQQEPVAK